MRLADHLKISLIESKGIIYLEKDGEKSVLCKPANPKKIWSETYNILHEMLPKDKRRVFF